MNAVAGVHEDDSQYYEGAVYYEAPFGTRTAVVFAPWGEWDDRTEDAWRAEAVLGVKRVLRQTENSVIALQGSALWVSQPEYEWCSQGGAEVRLLSGYSFAEGAMFVNVESASRLLVGGCVGGRVDITAGYRPGPNWLAMGQVFYDSPVTSDDTLKAQFTLVRFDRQGRGWQQLGSVRR